MNNRKPILLAIGLVLGAHSFAADLTAGQILKKNLDATGGQAAYDKMVSLVSTATMDISMANMKGQIVTYQKSPGKVLVVMTIPGAGDSQFGYDGSVAWAKDKISGLRKLTGLEKTTFVRQALASSANWQTYFKTAKVAGRVKVDSHQTYAVKLVSKDGQTITEYFDCKSFMLLRTDDVQISPQGTFKVQSYFSDYRDVAGVKVPYVTTLKTPLGDMVATVTSAKANVPVDDSKFRCPPGK
jgi:hypothetical protein